MRIAVGQISCESNTFATFRCDLDTVRDDRLSARGRGALRAPRHRQRSRRRPRRCSTRRPTLEIVPLLATRWNSSSVLAGRRACATCGRGCSGRLQAAGPVDGVFLSCHGSMVAADCDDPEGELAESVRAIVGPVGADRHDPRPARQRHRPHGRERRPRSLATSTIRTTTASPTGERAARLLLRTVRGEIAPGDLRGCACR